jgi:very-short-patch-repair endonuclease
MANTLRVKSLNELGKGAWRVRENNQLPIPEPIHSQKKRSQRDSVRSIPQEKLWNAVLAIWPTRVRAEYRNAIPNRHFRVDIAFPDIKLAIEVDGWQFHGKHKSDFIKDRARQNLYVMHGWRVLRYTAGQINKDLETCIEQIREAVENS